MKTPASDMKVNQWGRIVKSDDPALLRQQIVRITHNVWYLPILGKSYKSLENVALPNVFVDTIPYQVLSCEKTVEA